MKLIPLNSSQITGVAYDQEAKKLQVVFTSGATYEYTGITPEAVCQVVFADSAGKAFNTHIKNSGYAYKKLADSVPAPAQEEVVEL